MKKSKFLLVLVLLITFLTNVNVFAQSSRFEGTYSVEQTMKNGSVYLTLGFKGENISNLSLKLAYEKKYFNEPSFETIEGYENLETTSDVDGRWKIISIDLSGFEEKSEDNFVTLVFEAKNFFREDEICDMFLYNYEAYDNNHYYTYIDSGNLLNIKRSSDNEIIVTSKDINKLTEYQYWIEEHWYLFALLILAFIALIAVIIILIAINRKHRKVMAKEQSQAVENQLNSNVGEKVGFKDMGLDFGTTSDEEDDFNPFKENEEKKINEQALRNANDGLSNTIDPFALSNVAISNNQNNNTSESLTNLNQSVEQNNNEVLSSNPTSKNNDENKESLININPSNFDGL